MGINREAAFQSIISPAITCHRDSEKVEMPDTETLEVKEVKEVKMIETEVETESKIEASVGENDVVALVDEAEHLNTSDTSEEMETNGSETQPQLDAVEENQK